MNKQNLLKLSLLVLVTVATLLVAFVFIEQTVSSAEAAKDSAVFRAEAEPYKNEAVDIVSGFGYWSIALTFAGFVAAGVVFFRRQKIDWRGLLKRHRYGILCVVLCTVFLHMHEPHRYKVLADEYLLASTAQSMHYDRQAAYTLHAHYVRGVFTETFELLDKRHLFYPFLLATVHDLLGYDPANTFVLNAVLSFALLGLLYGWCVRYGGTWAGAFAVILFSSLPLLAQNATSGSFAVLNLTFIVLLLHTAYNYLKRPGDEGLWLMILTAILLAQVRYESILFLLVLPVVALFKWWKEGKITVHWSHCLSPALLLIPLIIHRLHQVQASFWQLESKHSDTPFSIEYLANNFEHAVYYMFNFSGKLTNSVLLSVIGIVALVFFVVLVLTRLRNLINATEANTALLAVFAVLLANSALMFLYFWGEMDEAIVSRLWLPFFLMLVLVTPVVMNEFGLFKRKPAWFLGFGAFYLWLVTAPVNATALQTELLHASRITQWILQQLEPYEKDRVFVIHGRHLPLLVHQYAAAHTDYLNTRAKQIDFVIDFKYYDYVLYFETSRYNPNTKEEKPVDGPRFNEAFPREEIARYQLRPDVVIRCYRIYGLPEENHLYDQPDLPKFKTTTEVSDYIIELLP